MAKTYQECYNTTVEKSRDEIPLNDHLRWTQTVESIVEDHVATSSKETWINILDQSQPHDEWQVYCPDMTSHDMVTRAMAFVALHEDVRETLSEEFE